MVDILYIRFYDNPPGVNGWLAEARFIDESKGYKQTEWGPLLKWDKMITVPGFTFEEARAKLEKGITEILCRM